MAKLPLKLQQLWLARTAAQLVAPAANFATFSVRNAHGVMEFDPATAEGVFVEGVIPRSYQGGTLTVVLHWASDGATSGDVIWYGAFERITPDSQDLDADSFAAGRSVTDTAPGTDGHVTQATITFTQAQADGIAAGDDFRLMISRGSATLGAATEAGDTMNSNDAQLQSVEVYEA